MAKKKEYDFSGFDSAMAPSQPREVASLPKNQEQIAKQEQDAEKFSMAESALVKFADDLTFGNLDEATAGLTALTDMVSGGNKSLKEAYAERLKEARHLLRKSEEQNPVTSTLAGLTGSLAVPVGMMGNAAKGAGMGARMLDAGKAGAVVGGLSGMGRSEGADMSEVAKDTVTGAGVGALLGPVVEGTIGLAGKGIAKGKEFYKNNPTIQGLVEAFNVGQTNPDLLTKEGRKRIATEFGDEVENKLVPYFDDKLEKAGQRKYDLAREASKGESVNKSIIGERIMPEFNIRDFSASDNSRNVGNKLLEALNPLSSKTKIDGDDAFRLRSQLQDLMDRVQGNPTDIDAYRALSKMKTNLDNMMETELKIPMKELGQRYGKISDFKAQFGSDINAKGSINAAKRAEVQTKEKLMKQFMDAVEDESSDQALKMDKAFKDLADSGLIDPSEIQNALSSVKDKAKVARVMRDTYGSAGFPGGATDFFASGGLGIKSLATTGSVMAGQASVPVYKAMGAIADATPEVLKRAAGMTKDPKLANILGTLSDQPSTKRRAMLYNMMQQPAYREALQELFKDDSGK